MFLLLNVYYVSLPVRLGPMDDFLLWDLPVKDTHALSLTGYIGHDAVESFRKRSYRIELFLCPFFTLLQYKAFRVLQSITGLLIAGSSALQFMDRVRYPDTDLNLYVEQNFAADVHEFLVRIGYELVSPSDVAFPDINAASNTVASVIRHELEARQSLSYSGSTIIGSFHYRNTHGMRIVVKTTVFHPLLAILSLQNSRSYYPHGFHMWLITFSLRDELHHICSCYLLIPQSDFRGSINLSNSFICFFWSRTTTEIYQSWMEKHPRRYCIATPGISKRSSGWR